MRSSRFWPPDAKGAVPHPALASLRRARIGQKVDQRFRKLPISTAGLNGFTFSAFRRFTETVGKALADPTCLRQPLGHSCKWHVSLALTLPVDGKWFTIK